MIASRALAIAIGATACLALATPATAKSCAVSKFRFINQGAYYIAWISAKTEDNEYPITYSDGVVDGGTSKTYDITRKMSASEIEDITGQEVWAAYSIGGGGYKNCRKDGTQLYYHPMAEPGPTR